MTAKSYTEEEIREIAERQNLVGYPHLALMREKLSVKAWLQQYERGGIEDLLFYLKIPCITVLKSAPTCDTMGVAFRVYPDRIDNLPDRIRSMER